MRHSRPSQNRTHWGVGIEPIFHMVIALCKWSVQRHTAVTKDVSQKVFRVITFTPQCQERVYGNPLCTEVVAAEGFEPSHLSARGPKPRVYYHFHHAAILFWCEILDSNQYAFRHDNLNVACLPIPSISHIWLEGRESNSWPSLYQSDYLTNWYTFQSMVLPKGFEPLAFLVWARRFCQLVYGSWCE